MSELTLRRPLREAPLALLLLAAGCGFLVFQWLYLFELEDPEPRGVLAAYATIPLVPYLFYLFWRDLTTQIELTDAGIRAGSRLGFGDSGLRSGQTPLLPYSCISRVTAEWTEHRRGSLTGKGLRAVVVEGKREENRWRLEVTPDMEHWEEGLVFIAQRVGASTVSEDVQELLPPEVRPSNPRSQSDAGLHGFARFLRRA